MNYKKYLFEDEDNYLEEAKYKIVVRGKKRKKKIICPSPNTKAVNGKCVPMTGVERINRMKAQLRAAKKRKRKLTKTLKKRAKSMAIRNKLSLFTSKRAVPNENS